MARGARPIKQTLGSDNAIKQTVGSDNAIKTTVGSDNAIKTTKSLGKKGTKILPIL
jgi:hypothetical protein